MLSPQDKTHKSHFCVDISYDFVSPHCFPVTTPKVRFSGLQSARREQESCSIHHQSPGNSPVVVGVEVPLCQSFQAKKVLKSVQLLQAAATKTSLSRCCCHCVDASVPSSPDGAGGGKTTLFKEW